MKNLNDIVEALTEEEAACNRRDFISNTGKSILTATVLSGLASCTSNAQQQGIGSSPTNKEIHAASVTQPIELKPLDHPTEKKEEPLPAPQEPDKRIGFAIAGLGKLSLGQLLPAFGACKYAKVTALVSSSPEKARKVARQYDVPETGIYSYQNFDDIKNNPEVDVVYRANARCFIALLGNGN